MTTMDELAAMPAEDIALALVLKLRGGDPIIARTLAAYVEQSAPASVSRAVQAVMDRITAKQPLPVLPVREIEIEWLRDVAEEIRAQGCAPSLADLAQRWTLSSPACARFRILRLREANLVDWQDGKIRSLRLTREARRLLTVESDRVGGRGRTMSAAHSGPVNLRI